jgi:hypothetical protein
MKLLRTALLLLLALLAIDGLVGAANAATVRSAAAMVVCAQTVVSEEVIETVQSVVTDEATDIADCQSGHCRGSSCHCSCHGVVGGLPTTYMSSLSLAVATNYPRPFPVVTSRHPSPPVRPPRA